MRGIYSILRAFDRLDATRKRALSSAAAAGACAAALAGLLSIVVGLPIVPVALLAGGIGFVVGQRTHFVR